jgi:streptogrisin C
MRRTLSVCVAITVAAGGIAASSPAVAAAAAPPVPAPSPAPPGLLQAMQRDLGLTEAQAKTRVADEATAARVSEKLRTNLGADFAGSWVADTTLTVAVTSPAAAAKVRAEGATAKVVEHTSADLDAVMSKLDAKAAAATDAISNWHVDVKTNTVVLVADPGATSTAATFVASAGVAAADVTIVAKEESPRPLYDIVGGDPYYINGTSRCSIGFSVVGGFVTAGHCGTPGASTTGYNGAAQGTFQASSFPGDDMAWVATNANWTPQPWVNLYNGTAAVVGGSTAAPPGSAICRSGSTTGWHCGTVQATGSTVNYPQGTVYELTMTNVCAEPGDSGGSWLSGNQAQGVTSGGSGNCTSGGTTYFQPVNEILGRYGLTLVTG